MSQQPPYSDFNDPYRTANDPSRYYNDPYAYGDPSVKRPVGVILYWILCGVMIVLGVLWLSIGIWSLSVDNATFNDLLESSEPLSADEQLAVALVLVVFGPLMMLVYAVAYFLPRRPWAWICHLILQIFALLGTCLGCCFISPYAVVVLIFWCLAPTRAWYGMGQSGGPPMSGPGGYAPYAGYGSTYQQPYGSQPSPQTPPPQEPWRQ